MRIAVLGGSFNPVHIGHLFLAGLVLSKGYDRIILIPAYQSPFKLHAENQNAPEIVSPADRLDMLLASVTADWRLAIDDCEIRREGVSYTIDTIADIKERYRPEGKPGLILGDDLSETFHLWRSAQVIAEETDIIVARRLFDPRTFTDGVTRNEALAFPYPHIKLDNALIDVSSSMIRGLIAHNGNWRCLVSPGAGRIIEDRGLYGYRASHKNSAENSGKGITLENTAFLENAARRSIGQSRFLHSRNTALIARDLCERFNVNPLSGYLAGITHDICKSMDGPELLALAKTDKLKISKLEEKKHSLLHGRAAAVLLQKHYNIDDEAVLEAVRCHVTGGQALGKLARIVYIADKIEVSRHWVDPRFRDTNAYRNLDDLFFAVLNNTVNYLNSRNVEIAGETRDLLLTNNENS